jgi:Domain of unknown function (DUF4412)
MKRIIFATLLAGTVAGWAATNAPFTGLIRATLTRGGDAQTLLYTVGTSSLRIECLETDRPYPCDIIDLTSGQLTLLFPNNRSFVRLKSVPNNSSSPPGFPAMPAMPNLPAPSQGLPPGVGPQAGNGSSLPQMPGGMPPMPMMEKTELTATGDTTNLLGYACQKFVIKQRGEVMEIWATDKLLRFQPYLQNQPHRFGPRMIEEQWGELLKAKKLFPLLAVLRFDRPAMPGSNVPPVPGPERMRFEVTAVTPDKITDETLFQPLPF